MKITQYGLLENIGNQIILYLKTSDHFYMGAIFWTLYKLTRLSFYLCNVNIDDFPIPGWYWLVPSFLEMFWLLNFFMIATFFKVVP